MFARGDGRGLLKLTHLLCNDCLFKIFAKHQKDCRLAINSFYSSVIAFTLN